MRAGDFVGAKIYRKPTEDKRTKKDGTPRSPKKLGKIHFPVFTPGGTRVVGFMVRQSDIAGMIERPDRFVALDAIGVYEGAIAVDDVKDTYDAAAAKRLDINLDDCIIWVGMDVRTESGDVVGYCSDVEFKPRSGIVQAFYVTAGAASSVLVGDTQVPPTMLRGYENGAMVVSDEVKSLGYSGGAAAKAAEAVARLTRSAVENGVGCIYKKTDSALRGNIGAELAALLKASGARNLPFLPAFPQIGRTTEKGVHYIKGVPVNESPFGIDPFEPVRCAEVTKLIHLQTEIPAQNLRPGETAADKTGILVYDAATAADLETAGRQLFQNGTPPVLAGCAGFAAFLPELLGLSDGSVVEPPQLDPRLLVLCGSVNPITLRQMDTAEKAGIARLRLTPRHNLEPGYWASADGKAALAEIEAMLAANPRCIIETNDAGGNQLTADYAAARGIDLDGMRVGISGSVGQMFGALFGSEHLGTLLLTGGDTLLQCMNSVGARELEPVCELESGIVLARFTYQGRTRYVITKSGGFGQEDLLVELADRIAKH